MQISLLIQTRWLFHWRKRYYGLGILAKSDGLNKNVLVMDLFLINAQLSSSQDVNWWTGVVWITCGLLWCFYQLFGLSFWRHPFTADDPLLSKWWNASFLQIWWRNTLIHILDGLRVSTFSANFHFWVNFIFNTSNMQLRYVLFYSHLSFIFLSLSLEELYNHWPTSCPCQQGNDVMTCSLPELTV